MFNSVRLLIVVGLLALTGMAFAQGTFRNQRIFVVPTPGPVTIDGDLQDWDQSGDIYCYIAEPTKDTLYTHTMMMYDKDALYLGGRIGDTSPMMSRWDPAVNPDFGWDADAFQLRLSLDPALGYPVKVGPREPNESLVHMTLWYYTDAKQPVLHMKFGMDFHDVPEYPKGIVPKEKFQAAYKAWPDGKGYTFEYRIPWTTLRAKTPLKGGDLVAGAIQTQWGNPLGTVSSGGWGVDLMAFAGFSYQSAQVWGKVIFAEKGHLPKEITQIGSEQPAAERTLPLKFDFTMPHAQQLSVALYNARGDLVRHIVVAKAEKAGAVTENWDGIDDAGHALPAGKYTWKAVTHDPFSVKYVLSVNNSGTPGYPTADGTGAWGGDWGNPIAVTFAGEKAVLTWSGSEAGPGLIVLDGHEKKLWGSRYGMTAVATDGEWIYAYIQGEPNQIRTYAVADGKQTNFLRGELWTEPNAGKETHCTGMAYLNGKLYVSDAAAGTLTEYHARQGTMLRTLKVADAHGMAVVNANTLAVISQGTVQKVHLDDSAVTPWITDHLDQPLSIAVGPDGVAYVGNAGVTMNVAVFGKNGKYLRSIGKRGGRLLPAACFDPSTKGNISPTMRGKWQPTAMINPAGVALDAKGRLWVTENDFQPKRISIWEAKTGKLLEEKFGPAYVSTPVTMDPADPTRVYCNNVEWKVDLKSGAWAANAVMIDARKDSPYFWPHMILINVFTAKNGKQYMHERSADGQFLFVRRGDHFEGAAGIVFPTMWLSWRKALPTDDPRLKSYLLWTDLNADGLVGSDEVQPTKLQPGQMHSVFDADLNMYCTGMYNALYWERISPAMIRQDGVPFYDEKTLLHVDYAKHHSLYTSDTAINPIDGSVLMYGGSDIKYLDQTDIWPLTYWSKDGKLLWRFRNGCRWYDGYNFPIPRPDQYWGCTKNIGITDGITGFSSYFGFVHLLTTDGVALGTLMQDGRTGSGSGPDHINCEWFTGQLVKLNDGRWLLLGGDQDGRVLQVVGLNSLQRSAGEYIITEGDAKAAADALVAWSSQQAKAQSLVVARTQGAPTVPGWQNIPGVKLNLDEKRNFTIKTAYDTANLYLKYTVSTNFPLVNSIQEAQLLFKGGNCIDLQLAADPTADAKRTTPAPGDIRVLITQRDGKPLAVAYRPQVAGFTGDPTLFTSPTGKEAFDVIEVWNDVKVDYSKTLDGFDAVVTLPLARLGWKPAPGTTVKMDVGYLFGNETGNIISVRKYWSNASFSAGVTNDVPNESRLEPAQWGMATVE